MTDDEIQVFIDGALTYFESVSGEPARVEPPFLHGDSTVTLDYTGIIGISGRHRGAVYFTSSSDLLIALLRTFGIPGSGSALLGDLVGEVANTISGSARRYYGGDFLVSVPIVLEGSTQSNVVPPQSKSVVIPIVWKDSRSYLIVALGKVAERAAHA